MTRLRTAAVLAALALGAMAPAHCSEPTAPFGPQLVRVHTDLVLRTADDRDRLEASGLEWRVTIRDLLAREAATTWPALVRTFTLGRPTLDGRTVRALEIGSDVRRHASGRPTFVMLGLHHAREWPSAEHTLEFAHDLVRGYGRDPRITRLLDRLRVVLVPVVNADGFDLSRTSGGLLSRNYGTWRGGPGGARPAPQPEGRVRHHARR